MELKELLSALPWEMQADVEYVEVKSLAFDSREVKRGDLFVAFKGLEFDGHQYIPDAIESGAAALVVEDKRFGTSPSGEPWPVPCVLVPNGREALAHLSAAYHGFPSRQLRLIGVTGTDGKTTTVNLIWSVLQAAGHRVGLISSVNAVIGDAQYDTGLHTTTPDALEVQGYLAQMVEAGAQYAVLEATSHGLAQHRVTACDFDVAVVTNITHEHLDYHGTFQEYRQAKARLFRSLTTSVRKPKTPKVSVLNADDDSFSYLQGIRADMQLTYGLHRAAQFSARDIAASPRGSSFTAVTPRGTFPVETKLVGRFNVYNALAAVTAALSQDIAIPHIQRGITAVSQVIGRMERVRLGQPFEVVIDFAHTPNSLRHSLQAAREMADGQITVVFGCAGLRDRQKRPVMGQIAGQLADRVIITAEDPRTEDLSEIVAQIAEGCEREGKKEGTGYWKIDDRGEAIQLAVDMAEEGDLVLITGKGHEKSMCFGTSEYPWSDHEAVAQALSGWRARGAR